MGEVVARARLPRAGELGRRRRATQGEHASVDALPRLRAIGWCHPVGLTLASGPSCRQSDEECLEDVISADPEPLVPGLAKQGGELAIRHGVAAGGEQLE